MIYKYMDLAIKQAKEASKNEEVPVGAVIIKEGRVIASAYNKTKRNNDITAHAEILVIKEACKKEGITNLMDGYELYVTLEPCAMCAGAIKNAKIGKVVFGAYDLAEGACGSRYDIINNKNTQLYCGINEDVCKDIISDFFMKLRANKEDR